MTSKNVVKQPQYKRNDILKVTEIDQIDHFLNQSKIDLPHEVRKNEITLDMRKVLLLVYHNWKIPTSYLKSFLHFLRLIHLFKRNINKKCCAPIKLFEKKDQKKIVDFVFELLKKLKNSNKLNSYWSVRECAFTYGVWLESSQKPDNFEILNYILHPRDWSELRYYHVKTRKFQSSMKELDNCVKNYEENEIVYKSHPSQGILSRLNELMNVENTNNKNGNNNFSNNDSNEMYLRNEYDKKLQSNNEIVDISEVSDDNDGNNGSQENKILCDKPDIYEQMDKLRYDLNKTVMDQHNSLKTQMTDQIEKLRTIVEDVIKAKRPKSISSDEDNLDKELQDSHVSSIDKHSEEQEAKESEIDLPEPTLFRSKHHHELLKDSRYDEILTKSTKPKELVASKKESSKKDDSSKNDKKRRKSKSSKKSKKSSSSKLYISGLSRTIPSGFGGDDSSSSTSSFSENDDNFGCVTPEKRKKLKKYRKKEYDKDGVSYMNDQINPQYEHEELTDDENIIKKLEFDDKDKFRVSYVFNIPYKDKHNLKFESLLEPKYVERLNLDSKDLTKEIKKDKYFKDYNSVSVKYEDISEYPASKMMSSIRSAISRNSNKDSVTDNYLVDYFCGIKSRLFLLNQVVGPNVLMINNYQKYILNIRLLEINKKMKKFKKFKKRYQQLYDKYAQGSVYSTIAFDSLIALRSVLTYILYDLNMCITQLEYDMKSNHKLDLTLKAFHLVMMKGAGKLQQETDKYIKKHAKDKTGLFTLVDEPKPSTLIAKIIDKTSQNNSQKDEEKHAYMDNNPKIKFDDQLGRVRGKIFNSNNRFKRNNYNNGNNKNNNNNKNYQNNNNNNNYGNLNNYRNNYRGKNKNKNNYRNNNNRNNYNNYRNNNNNNNRRFSNNNNLYNNSNNYQNNNNNNNNNQNQNNQQQQQGRFPQRYDNRDFNKLNNYQQQNN